MKKQKAIGKRVAERIVHRARARARDAGAAAVTTQILREPDRRKLFFAAENVIKSDRTLQNLDNQLRRAKIDNDLKRQVLKECTDEFRRTYSLPDNVHLNPKTGVITQLQPPPNQ